MLSYDVIWRAMIRHWRRESSCTLADALATRVSKACCDIRAACSGFPSVCERCGGALHQPTYHSEIITHFVVEVPTQTCWRR